MRTLIKLVAATATGAGALILGSGAAFAGTNGQQIEFYDQRGDVNSVYLSGTNQNGQPEDVCLNTPGTTNYLSGWWWKGDMEISWYPQANCGGNNIAPSPEVFTIPTSQSSDWYEITD